MSRIGNAPIEVPSGVDVSVSGNVFKAKGSKGELSFGLPEKINVKVEESTISVSRIDDQGESKALHGLSRALLNNMVIGVSEGFKKELEIVGVGYRAKAQGKNKLELLLGFSHPINYEAPEGIEFDVPEPTKITVSGIDKQIVGQVAAEIRSYRPPEPYKGKGVKYVGERILRKAGKAGK